MSNRRGGRTRLLEYYEHGSVRTGAAMAERESARGVQPEAWGRRRSGWRCLVASRLGRLYATRLQEEATQSRYRRASVWPSCDLVLPEPALEFHALGEQTEPVQVLDADVEGGIVETKRPLDPLVEEVDVDPVAGMPCVKDVGEVIEDSGLCPRELL